MRFWRTEEDTLVLLLRSEADTINRLSSSVQGDGLNPHVGVADIAVLQAAVAANGLPNRIAQGLLQLGLTPSNVDAIRDSFLGATPTSLATDLSAVMRTESQAAQEASGVFAQASPTAPLMEPTISVSGGTFVYDGSSHGALVTATGASGAPIRGLSALRITWRIGSAGQHQYVDNDPQDDPNYTNATGTGTITITDSVPLQTVAQTGDLQVGRVSHQSTVLANGFVLASGGAADGRL